jgi:hypothetical protein
MDNGIEKHAKDEEDDDKPEEERDALQAIGGIRRLLRSPKQ